MQSTILIIPSYQGFMREFCAESVVIGVEAARERRGFSRRFGDFGGCGVLLAAGNFAASEQGVFPPELGLIVAKSREVRSAPSGVP
ncbi:hypothetical protein BOSEA31B_13372 [Hyphomicrobiales bacterium]|nr:hypothetical protein BOSEA31B_13372 [Hyphomicrobiales bacterium]CAH1699144.1 hypothetical protein BOSEA1005_12197 [Hyphomicrobiales bacterium]CAI0342936.1 hypothetical protein BO1005MUT1_200081 [Hyphomicrobiales bacterium]